MGTGKHAPPDPDITVELNSGVFFKEESEELVENLRAKTDLRIVRRPSTYYSEGHPFPPDVILGILYTLVPLKELYVEVLAAAIWDSAKRARARLPAGQTSKVSFMVRELDEDGATIKQVSGVTDDPEIIKDLIRRVDK